MYIKDLIIDVVFMLVLIYFVILPIIDNANISKTNNIKSIEELEKEIKDLVDIYMSEYFVINIKYHNKRISDSDEDIIFRELCEEIVNNMSKKYRKKISIYYNEKKINHIIVKKIKIQLTDYITKHNIPK